MVKKKELNFKDNLKKNNIGIICLKLLFKKITFYIININISFLISLYNMN